MEEEKVWHVTWDYRIFEVKVLYKTDDKALINTFPISLVESKTVFSTKTEAQAYMLKRASDEIADINRRIAEGLK
ncbi:MAG: hypothetical protein KGI50_05655 [Patescibacteria group bacterium]|nr:hypothetical protein [Patescibacteria group bacterium]MDE2438883.1 hypothetical protein [Patescibacteria group bacterium]